MTRQESSHPSEIEGLRREISETREELGATVSELVAKADVKALARAKSAEAKQRMTHTAKGLARPQVALPVGAGLAATTAGVILRARVRRARSGPRAAVGVQHGVRWLANSQ